jgi:uncharacterized protein
LIFCENDVSISQSNKSRVEFCLGKLCTFKGLNDSSWQPYIKGMSMEGQKTPLLKRGAGFSFFKGRREKRQSILLDHPIENQKQCLGCDGECCRSFPSMEISWEEFEILKSHGATRLYFSLAGHHKFIIENGCEFLFRGKCSIYEDRPDICRRFICLTSPSLRNFGILEIKNSPPLTKTHPGCQPQDAYRCGIAEPL